MTRFLRSRVGDGHHIYSPSWRTYDVLRTDVADCTVQTDLNGVIVWASADLAEFVGIPAAALRGRAATSLVKSEELERVLDSEEMMLAGSDFDETIVHLRAADGSWNKVAMRPRPIQSESHLSGLLLTFLDVVEYSATMSALATQSRVTDVLMRGCEPQQMLSDFCDAVAGDGDHLGAQIWLSPDGDEAKSLALVAEAGPDTKNPGLAPIGWGDDAAGQGPIGRAIRTGRPQVTQDVLEPVAVTDSADSRQPRERARIALPVHWEGQGRVALSIDSEHFGAFDSLARELFVDLATWLGLTLSRLGPAELPYATEVDLSAPH